MSPKKYTERELIDALRGLAEHLGRAPSAADAGEDPQSPVRRTYQLHFGSWLEALEAAGIEPEPSQTGYSREELLQRLRDLTERLGCTPRQVDMDGDPRTPHASTYWKRFGRWNAAVRAAGLTPRRVSRNPEHREDE